jgi:L-arabonate dehydrase
MCWRRCRASASSRWCKEDLTLSKILTREAFENAIRVNAAIGGSTNAVIHLKAIAGRIGVPLELEDWTRIGKRHADHRRPAALGPLPDGRVLLRRRPAGRDAPPGRKRPAAAPDALTVNGRSLWDNCARRRSTTTR